MAVAGVCGGGGGACAGAVAVAGRLRACVMAVAGRASRAVARCLVCQPRKDDPAVEPIRQGCPTPPHTLHSPSLLDCACCLPKPYNINPE